MNQNQPIDSQHEPQSKSNLSEQSKIKKIKTKQTMAEAPVEDEDQVYERVKQSRFKQQNLPAWRPVPTILSIVIVFSSFGILFIILGIVLLVYSNKVHSAKIEYTDCALNSNCIKQLTLKENIDAPVFIEIDQLTGDDINSHDDCEPAETNKQMGFPDNKIALDGVTTLNPNSYAVPCGLMAKTFFNDSFSFKIGDEEIQVDEKNIAFGKDWTDITDEHFLVWMRPSGLPNPRKLWGRINRDLKKGETIDITINNQYNVNNYKGKKKIVLSNATKFGGKNKFLGVSYIVVGALSILCAILFPVGYKFQMQKEKEL